MPESEDRSEGRQIDNSPRQGEHGVPETTGSSTPATTKEVSAEALAGLFGVALAADETIGPYRLTQLLGEGGMGLVFEAFQEEPLQRRVALKVIRRGLGTREVVSRFESERQALALMEHPNIAQVFDAGYNAVGLPYFVMELVHGTPLTTYCRQRSASLEERLRLFLEVCSAVGHAHQKGVIHRDLKPSNLLVDESTELPRVKVIDFGIAKALNANLAPDAELTADDQILGTPGYMSPEQLTGGAAAIDTRSDVYSLGVVLFELLADALPYHRGAAGDWTSLRKQVDELPVPRPSSVINDAEHRGLTSVPVDLDWIVATALAPEPTRRYVSVAELKADIERFLDDQPVLARPPARLDRIYKFAKRHRVAVGFATVISISLLASLVAISLSLVSTRRSAEQAAQSARESEEAQQFLVSLFAQADPLENRGTALEAGEILERGRAKMETRLHDQPAVRARLLTSLGAIYDHLGEWDTAAELLEEATASAEQALGAGSLQVNALTLRSDALRAAGKPKEAIAAARRAMSTADLELEERRPEALYARRSLGLSLVSDGRLDEGLQHLAAVAAALALLEPRPELELARTLTSIANVARALGRSDQAREALQKAAAIFAEEDPLHPEHPWVLNGLALLAQDRADHAAARQLLERSLAIQIDVYGTHHPYVAHTLNDLGAGAWQQGEVEQARDLWLRSLEIRQQLHGSDHPDLAQSLGNLGLAHRGLGQLSVAEDYYRQALAMEERLFGKSHPTTARTISNLSLLLRRQRRFPEALRLAERAANIAAVAHGATAIDTLWAESALVQTSRAAGRLRDAQVRSESLLERLTHATQPPESLLYFAHLESLLLATLGQHLDPERLERTLQRTPEFESPHRLMDLHLLRSVSSALLGRRTEAEQQLARYSALLSEQQDGDNATRCYREARVYALLGDPGRAEARLTCAADLGWAEYPLELDPALRAVRTTSAYRRLQSEFKTPTMPDG